MNYQKAERVLRKHGVKNRAHRWAIIRDLEEVTGEHDRLGEEQMAELSPSENIVYPKLWELIHMPESQRIDAMISGIEWLPDGRLSISQKTLGKITNLSEPSVGKALRLLRDCDCSRCGRHKLIGYEAEWKSHQPGVIRLIPCPAPRAVRYHLAF